jgi:hypothetical protein
MHTTETGGAASPTGGAGVYPLLDCRPLRSADPTIIFLHIGKTAGSSLRGILRRQVRRDQILEFRAPLPEPGRLRREGGLAAFAAIPEADRARARLVMGHAPYGLHELIPRPSTYVTMLRDPVELVVSLYRYIGRTPNHILHDELRSRGLPLEGFVTSGLSLETDNSQTRALAGDMSAPFGGCDEEMLATARAHLEDRFAVVGLTDRFDESLLLMGRAFDWSRLYYVAANVAPTAERVPPSPETVEQIRAANSLDVELYAWATERFEQTIASDPTFDVALERFRRRNRLYRPWGRLTDELPRKAAARLHR